MSHFLFYFHTIRLLVFVKRDKLLSQVIKFNYENIKLKKSMWSGTCLIQLEFHSQKKSWSCQRFVEVDVLSLQRIVLSAFCKLTFCFRRSVVSMFFLENRFCVGTFKGIVSSDFNGIFIILSYSLDVRQLQIDIQIRELIPNKLRLWGKCRIFYFTVLTYYTPTGFLSNVINF
jgi:hypothetical protein